MGHDYHTCAAKDGRQFCHTKNSCGVAAPEMGTGVTIDYCKTLHIDIFPGTAIEAVEQRREHN